MSTDAGTTVGDLRAAVAAFVDARDWRPFHSPKNLAMSIAIEAAEILELFQWLDNDQAWAAGDDPATRAALAEELADVLIYCLSLSNALDLDLSEAVLSKLQLNEIRYPADEFRGRYRRPERDKGGS
ncbi:MAG: nucleotide pyrophosphohydrolase [Anaerolineae bacterium]